MQRRHLSAPLSDSEEAGESWDLSHSRWCSPLCGRCVCVRERGGGREMPSEIRQLVKALGMGMHIYL